MLEHISRDVLEHTSDYKSYSYGLDGCFAWKVIPIVLNEKPYQRKKVPTLSARDWHTATTYPRRGTEQQQDRHGLHPWGAPITPGHCPLYIPLCVHHGGAQPLGLPDLYVRQAGVPTEEFTSVAVKNK